MNSIEKTDEITDDNMNSIETNMNSIETTNMNSIETIDEMNSIETTDEMNSIEITDKIADIPTEMKITKPKRKCSEKQLENLRLCREKRIANCSKIKIKKDDDKKIKKHELALKKAMKLLDISPIQLTRAKTGYITPPEPQTPEPQTSGYITPPPEPETPQTPQTPSPPQTPQTPSHSYHMNSYETTPKRNRNPMRRNVS